MHFPLSFFLKIIDKNGLHASDSCWMYVFQALYVILINYLGNFARGKCEVKYI